MKYIILLIGLIGCSLSFGADKNFYEVEVVSKTDNKYKLELGIFIENENPKDLKKVQSALASTIIVMAKQYGTYYFLEHRAEFMEKAWKDVAKSTGIKVTGISMLRVQWVNGVKDYL